MKIKYVVLLTALVSCVVLPLAAQPVKYLSPQLLDKFLATYAPLQEALQNLDEEVLAEVDLSQVGDEFEPYEVDGIRTYIKSAGSHPAVLAVLKQYGWDAGFWDVLITVAFSMMYADLEEVLKVYGSEEMIELVDTIGGQLAAQDRALVAERRSQLETVMEGVLDD
ncbi:MAG: hypothetical protein KKI09_05260 [Spirochaetes bacterium]|nr:hypothetical protein [Spirochaetota bacterium]MBU0954822.1 hypothetical protein [Spirochaetota bacterium]